MSNDPTFEDYRVKLEVFEGPLDLLLYLIRRDEIDIYDISIERITSQYMAFLDMMKMLDLGIAGEFLVMASTLMLIKSRMLLPVAAPGRDGDQDDIEDIDPRLDLVRQLVEYKKFKDAAGQLMERETIQSERFLYGGEAARAHPENEEARVLEDIGLFDLLTAFQEVLERTPLEPLGHLEPIRWSVPDKMESIMSGLRRKRELVFSRLFSPGSHRGEVIITFLALLELLRLRQVAIQQPEAFSEITISFISDDETAEAAPPLIGGRDHV